MLEGLVPLELDDINPEPIIWELVSLRVQELLSSLLPFEGELPSLHVSLDLLNLSDKDSNIVGGVDRELLKLSSSTLDFLVEGTHRALEFASKLVENLLMPLVILVVDLLLDATVIDDDGAEVLLVVGGVEGLSSLSDLIEKLRPLLHVILEHVEDLGTLEVPESLVLLPNVEVAVGSPEYLLQLCVGIGDAVVLHLLDEAVVEAISLVVLVAIVSAITLRLDSLEAANDFNLTVQLSVQE